MRVLFVNYGSESLALLQWAQQQALSEVTVVSIDTGWAAPGWQAHVAEAEAFVQRCGFKVLRLQASPNFAELTMLRHSFPSKKFQWCASMLKGLTLLNWLDNVDVQAQATIVLAKRRSAARSDYDLAEYVEQSDYFGGRRVWHPLYLHSVIDRDALLSQAGFSPLAHRSLECAPCIYNSTADFQAMTEVEIQRVARLEITLEQSMFEVPIAAQVAKEKNSTKLLKQEIGEQFALSCGASFGCGL